MLTRNNRVDEMYVRATKRKEGGKRERERERASVNYAAANYVSSTGRAKNLDYPRRGKTGRAIFRIKSSESRRDRPSEIPLHEGP